MPHDKKTPNAAQCRAWAWVALIGLAALAIRLYHLDFNGLRGDEFITLKTCRTGVSDLIDNRIKGGHFPTYFLALKLWMAVCGESEIALRLPSALMGAATAVYLALAGARMWGRGAGAAAGAIAAVHPVLIWSSQFARPYVMVFLCAAAAMHALMAALQTGRRGWWRTWTVWMALGLVSQAMFLFMAIAQGLVVGVWAWRRRAANPEIWLPFRRCVLLLSVFAVLTTGYLGYKNKRNHDKGMELMRADPTYFYEGPVYLLGDYFAVRQRPAVRSGLFALALASAAGAAFAGRKKTKEPDAPPVWGLAMATAFSLIVILGVMAAFMINTVRTYQYFSGGAVGMVLLMGGAMAAVPVRVLRPALAVAAAVIAAGFGWARLNHVDDQLREAVRCVAENRKLGEPLLFCTFKDNTQLRLDYFGLPVEPFGFRLDDKHGLNDPERLAEGLAPMDSFWAVLYEVDVDNARALLESAGRGAFRLVENRRFNRAGALHYERR